MVILAHGGLDYVEVPGGDDQRIVEIDAPGAEEVASLEEGDVASSGMIRRRPGELGSNLSGWLSSVNARWDGTARSRCGEVLRCE